MSEVQRRDVLIAMGLAAAALAEAAPAQAGDPSFMNNVPDPVTSGAELPTFKFALGKSKGIAGVSMKLEPGAMRELHWHATAAEWAFVLEGRVRTTVIDPRGEAETNEFEPGDIWYFPRGYGHMLQCLGKEP